MNLLVAWGQLEQPLAQPDHLVGKCDWPEEGLRFEVMCPHSHRLPLCLAEQCFPFRLLHCRAAAI